MSDQLENLKAEDISIGDRPLSIPSELPVLPLRDTVLFPNSFMPLAVARESSVRLIDEAISVGTLAMHRDKNRSRLYPTRVVFHTGDVRVAALAKELGAIQKMLERHWGNYRALLIL